MSEHDTLGALIEKHSRLETLIVDHQTITPEQEKVLDKIALDTLLAAEIVPAQFGVQIEIKFERRKDD